jgi:hypothetical protein
MTDFDQQRIARWIRDAFTILCIRHAGSSRAERRLRLGFEAILIQLGTSPLHLAASTRPPPGRAAAASMADLRRIIDALDHCRAIFQRYESVLNPAQRKVHVLVETTREHALEELSERLGRVLARPEVPALS